jgi:hypothetical protein
VILICGDKIRLLDGIEYGIVSEILPHGKVKVEIEGIEQILPQSAVVKIDAEMEQIMRRSSIVKKDRNRPSATSQVSRGKNSKSDALLWGRVSGMRNRQGIPEFDLHMDALPLPHKGLTKSEAIDTQKQYAIQCIEEALKRRETALVFIHGVGKGVLKGTLMRIAREYELRTEDASMRDYGVGAIKFILRG